MKKTTEHGQILMTIENLYFKCKTREELIIARKEFNIDDYPKNFDNMQVAGAKAINQLQIIRQVVENFGRLSS